MNFYTKFIFLTLAILFPRASLCANPEQKASTKHDFGTTLRDTVFCKRTAVEFLGIIGLSYLVHKVRQDAACDNKILGMKLGYNVLQQDPSKKMFFSIMKMLSETDYTLSGDEFFELPSSTIEKGGRGMYIQWSGSTVK